MDPIIFRYQIPAQVKANAQLTTQPTPSSRPFATGKLIGTQAQFPFKLGLVDTGSQVTFFPDDALYIGVRNLQPGRSTTWRGDTVPLRSGVVEIELQNHDGYLIRWESEVSFYPTAKIKTRYPLMGQKGFLEFFRAEFFDHDHYFTLDPLPHCPGGILLPNSPFTFQ